MDKFTSNVHTSTAVDCRLNSYGHQCCAHYMYIDIFEHAISIICLMASVQQFKWLAVAMIHSSSPEIISHTVSIYSLSKLPYYIALQFPPKKINCIYMSMLFHQSASCS